MALPNSNINVSMVKSALEASTNDVGQLCTHPHINEWSPYKPIKADSITLNEASREQLSGFSIIGKYLSYNKPTGGASSPYRLGDFRGYNHNSRKPQTFNISHNPLAPNEGATHGGVDTIDVNLVLPDINTFKKIQNEFGGVTHVSIYDSKGVLVGRIPIKSTINESTNDYYVDGEVTINLSDVAVGINYSRTYAIYYGNESDTYQKFRIPNNDLIIAGKVSPNGVQVLVDMLPHDNLIINDMFDFNITKTTNYNPITKLFTLSYLKITGSAKTYSGSTNTIRYDDFRNKRNWALFYRLLKFDGTIIQGNQQVSTAYMNSISADAVVGDPYGTYSIISSNTFQVSNVEHGTRIVFEIQYTGS